MNSFRLNTLYNMRLPCSSPGCNRRRKKSISRYCANHARTSAYFGHPLGYLVPKKAYAGHVKVARRLFRRLGDSHPALQAALQVVRGLLTQGPEPRTPLPLKKNARWLAWREKERLADVTPHEALAAVVGVWLYAFMNPRSLPSDARLTYQLAQTVFRLRQLAVTRSHYDDSTGKVDNDYRVPPAGAVQLLGRQLRLGLAPFLANVVLLVEAEHQESAARAMALRTPLAVATAK